MDRDVTCADCFRRFDPGVQRMACPHDAVGTEATPAREEAKPPHRWTAETASAAGRVGGRRPRRPKGLGKRRKGR